jgi:3-oxoacyl-[acyl-carrier-protein] synthase III
MENKTKAVGIIGVGSFLPENIVTNHDIAKLVETNDEWVVQRTGISERRVLDKDLPTYTMGVEAGKKAIEDAGLTPGDIDLILVTIFAPDYFTPSAACLIQKDLGATKAAAFDINVACTGFIYGVTIAQQFIETGFYKNVLVISCDANSKVLDWQDRNSCILFGDGAGAAVVSEVPSGYGIKSSLLGSDGTGGECITAPATYFGEKDLEKRIHDNKRVIWIDGSEVMKFAVRIMVSATNACIEKASSSIEDVSLLIPHQANIRIIEGAVKRLNISSDKVFKNVHKYGNMTSASTPVALCEAVKEGRIKDGDNIVLVGFGAGLTWGSIFMKWYKQ